MITIYLRRHGPRVCHRDALQVENGDTAQDLLPGFKKAELKDSDGSLKELLGRIFTRIPIAKTVDYYASTALGPIWWHRNHVIVAYMPHLDRVQHLMNLRVFLFEVVVIHYLSKDSLRKSASRFVCHEKYSMKFALNSRTLINIPYRSLSRLKKSIITEFLIVR